MNVKSENISISLDGKSLPGILNLVDNSKGLVVFAHGAGSSRISPRNTFVADFLNSKGFSTLLFDLLTEEEDEIYQNRFNIDLISSRLEEATKWILNQEKVKNMDLGYFGASTGAAAALETSSKFDEVKAVVSRGGRPDLVLSSLPKVKAPTLLIVGELDDFVIVSNRKAFETLQATKDFLVIPGATHLFEEPGALEAVAESAGDWFEKHLVKKSEA